MSENRWAQPVTEIVAERVDDEQVLCAFRLKEMKTFIHTESDDVLLRVRTEQPGFIWFSLHREDFDELAKYLTNDAAEMQRALLTEQDR